MLTSREMASIPATVAGPELNRLTSREMASMPAAVAGPELNRLTSRDTASFVCACESNGRRMNNASGIRDRSRLVKSRNLHAGPFRNIIPACLAAPSRGLAGGQGFIGCEMVLFRRSVGRTRLDDGVHRINQRRARLPQRRVGVAADIRSGQGGLGTIAR